jgi:hypothetical protein
MAAQNIDKSKWQAFFDRLSRGLVGMRAEIEVASLALENLDRPASNYSAATAALWAPTAASCK